MSCQHTWERRDKQPWCLPYYICTECEMELSVDQYDALQQARREGKAEGIRLGWEQCKYQALTAMRDIDQSTKDYEETFEKSCDAIATMTYKEADDGSA